jgi:glycine/D-amino acid oxidase-like deaminating enzyme
MGRIVQALTALYRRWKFVEEVDAPRGAAVPVGGEAQRLRRAIEQDERLSADYRRNGCLSLARDREASARALRSRLSMLD